MDQHKSKKKARDKIFEELSQLDHRDRVEMLANLILSEGISMMPTPSVPLTPENVFQTILQDRMEHGETIGNSLAMQGLLMLDWLHANQNVNGEKDETRSDQDLQEGRSSSVSTNSTPLK